MKRAKLTKNFIEAIREEGKFQDAEVPTLELWTGKRGKVFYFRKSHKFKQYRRTLGKYPEYTREMAVKQCHVYTANLAQYGALDPVEEGKKSKGITLEEAFQHYEKYRAPDRHVVGRWEKYFCAFAKRPIADISKAEFKSLHAEISKEAPTTANRAMAEIKAVINLAINDEIYEGHNPAAKIEMNRETPRVKFLMPDQAPEVIRVLNEMRENPRARNGADALLLMLYQGQRKGNVLAMEWSEINSENVWIVPKEKAKARKDIVSPLVRESIEILESRKGNKSRYVFPSSEDPDRPMQDCKKLWAHVKTICGISDLHIHDLRHTSATYQLRAGANIATVSDNLGHADIGITKRVYAHVLTDTRREALQNAAEALKGENKQP